MDTWELWLLLTCLTLLAAYALSEWAAWCRR